MTLPFRALSIAACFLVPAVLQSQQWMGTVLLPDGRTPVGGVVVVARDTAGRPTAQAVSNSEGRFTVFVDSARTLSLQLSRTGFAPTTTEPRRLAAEEVVDVVVTLGSEAIRI